MFKRIKSKIDNHFTYLRFCHYQIHNVILPYASFLLAVIPLLLVFILADLQHLEQDLGLVITLRILLALISITMLFVCKIYWQKYLVLGEALVVSLIHIMLLFIGQIAMSQGDYYYQSGSILILIYLAGLSRMPFGYTVCIASFVFLSYLGVIFPDKLAHDPAAEIDFISIYAGMFIISIVS